MIVNPFTGQVIINHPGHADQSVHSPKKGKFYKGVRDSTSRRARKLIYEGPFEDVAEAGAHSYVNSELDLKESNLGKGLLISKTGKYMPVQEGSLLKEDMDTNDEGVFEDYDDQDKPVKRKYRIVKKRKTPERMSSILEETLRRLRERE